MHFIEQFILLYMEKFLNRNLTGIISEKKDNEDDEEDDYPESRDRTVRASACPDSDSD